MFKVLLFKIRYLHFPLIWFRAWKSSGLPLNFFRSCALLHDGFWPSESGYKKSGKDFLCETQISLATKVNQWLYLITHSPSIGLLSMLSLYQMSCFVLTVTEVSTHPACFSHSGRENSLCCFSSSSVPSEVKLFKCSSSLELLVFSWSYLCPCSPRRNSHPQGPC